MYWREFWGFVKRNILKIVIATIVAVQWPWTLIFIIPIAFGIIRFQMFMWKMHRSYKAANKTPNDSNKQGHNREGKVTIVQTEHSEHRVNDDVGEYVDFKEIKEEETK